MQLELFWFCSKCKELHPFWLYISQKNCFFIQQKMLDKSIKILNQILNKIKPLDIDEKFISFFQLTKEKRQKAITRQKILRSIRKRVHECFTCGMGNTRANRLFGCNLDFLFKHIENQFKPGMTWKNYGHGNEKWTIDHIKPISKYFPHNLENLLKSNHYTNLQPMWYIDNIKKSNKYEPV